MSSDQRTPYTEIYNVTGVIISGDLIAKLVSITDQCTDAISAVVHVITTKAGIYSVIVHERTDMQVKADVPQVDGCENCPVYNEDADRPCGHHPVPQLILIDNYRGDKDLFKADQLVNSARTVLYQAVVKEFAYRNSYKSGVINQLPQFLQWIETQLATPVMVGRILAISSEF